MPEQPLYMQRKKKSKKGAPAVSEVAAAPKRGAEAVQVTVAPAHGGKKAKTSVLASLFHDDGGGERVKETFCCRSVGARGLNLS